MSANPESSSSTSTSASSSTTLSSSGHKRTPSGNVVNNGEVQYLADIVHKLDKDQRRSAWMKPDALRRSISDLKELINDLSVSTGSSVSSDASQPPSINSSTNLASIQEEGDTGDEWSEEEASHTDEIVDIESSDDEDNELHIKKKTPMVSLALKNTTELEATVFPTFATPQTGRMTPTKSIETKTMKPNPKVAMLTRSESPNPKFNSTSTLFMTTTLSKPDLLEVLHCVSKATHFHLLKGEDKSEKVYFPLFDERTHPLMKEFDNKAEPSENDVFVFMKTIFEFQRMDVECAIMCLVYIERLLELTSLTMDRTNWRRVCLGSIIFF